MSDRAIRKRLAKRKMEGTRVTVESVGRGKVMRVARWRDTTLEIRRQNLWTACNDEALTVGTEMHSAKRDGAFKSASRALFLSQKNRRGLAQLAFFTFSGAAQAPRLGFHFLVRCKTAGLVF